MKGLQSGIDELFMSDLSQTIHGLRPAGVLRTIRFAPGESVAALNPTYG